jgi:dihydrofolate reductase
LQWPWFKEEEAIGAAALLLGRKTYEGFAEAWPQYEGEPRAYNS